MTEEEKQDALRWWVRLGQAERMMLKEAFYGLTAPLHNEEVYYIYNEELRLGKIKTQQPFNNLFNE